MKNNVFSALMFASLLLTLATGCSKGGASVDTGIPASETFNYSDADGLLVAIKTVSTTENPYLPGYPITVEYGTAFVAFPSSPGSSSNLDAGVVKCQDSTLTKQSGNSYGFVPTSSFNITGLSFSGNSSWNVGGAGSINAFTHTWSPFPSTPTIYSDKETVSRSTGYTFNISSVSGADSLLFIIASGDKYAEKRTAGNATSVTFSSSDLSILGANNNGLLQVTPYKIQANTAKVPGKKLYFINMATVTDLVKIQ